MDYLTELWNVTWPALASLVVMLAILGGYARWLRVEAERRVDEWLKGA